jgi:Fic family protein
LNKEAGVARLLKRTWTSALDAGIPRRDRQSCRYEAYEPDALVGRILRIDGDVAADVADAEAAVSRLDREATTLTDTETLARLLLRAESVASSRIEGLEIGARRLLKEDARRALEDTHPDVTAAEVLGNIDAMTWSVEYLGSVRIDTHALLEINRRLLQNTDMEIHAGKLRERQNWIGGSRYNPCSAEYVPPPPELVLPLLEDLCAFCNGDSLPPIAQAALAHAQFETIHPFADGNGRVGRALIQVILRRRGTATRSLPPISLILATQAKAYVDALTGTRYIGPATSEQAQRGQNRWIATFAAACAEAVQQASWFERRIDGIVSDWRARLGAVRTGSATDLLIRRLPGSPILTVGSAAALIGRSFQATNEAISRLVSADILQQVSLGRRNRGFEAPTIIDAFSDFERGLATPAWDTRIEQPVRPVPRRRVP